MEPDQQIETGGRGLYPRSLRNCKTDPCNKPMETQLRLKILDEVVQLQAKRIMRLWEKELRINISVVVH